MLTRRAYAADRATRRMSARLLDTPSRFGDTPVMRDGGRSQQRLAEVLGAAFAEGLLSERTLAHRLGQLFGPRLIDPQRLVGDLTLRQLRHRRVYRTLSAAAMALRREVAAIAAPQPASSPLLLALSSTGPHEDLILGRNQACDVVLAEPTVSRRHARVTHRDGAWVLRDLNSTNGTTVNGSPVARCQIRPGDRLMLGMQPIEID
jgi:hypothetical protein